MHVLKNQTIFQCDFCNKRLLTKKGAKIHENSYCPNPKSPNMVNIETKKENCQHKNIDTIYGYIPGEAVKQPEYEICLDCGTKF